MPEATNPKFSETEVTFLLHENCGWGDINRFPSAVYVEHECDREHPYEEAGHTFYNRTHLRYVPERTTRIKVYELGDEINMKCDACGNYVDSFGVPDYCPYCGAKVVDDAD